MLAKILQKTKGKPCSCPSSRICSSCKSKKVIHPHVTVKEPRRLPTPVSVKYYNPPKSVYKHSPTVQYLDSKNNKIHKRKTNDSSPPTCINFSRWYKKRKALKALIKEKKEDDKRDRKRKREEFEKKRMADFINWELEKQRTQSLPPPKKKTVHIKERSASARPKPKPRTQSKHVTVKNFPHVTVKEPRRLPTPVSVKYYNPPKSVYKHSPTVQYLDSKNNKIHKRKTNDSSPPTCINFSRWYKKRKALKALIKEKKEDDKRERKRKREEFETKRMADFINWELEKQRTQSLPPPKKKTVHIKERSASARPKPKPRTQSKHVTVKNLDRKNTISNRFVNYCYRLCCQLYCCLTCVVLVVFIVIYIV